MKKIFENEHPLETPVLIGTDAEKIAGIKFWADLVALARSIDATFISFENKLEIIKFLKKELDLVDVEINNVSSQVVSAPGEIPSAEQLPPNSEDPIKASEPNIVDLSSPSDVTTATTPAVNLNKLRRAAGISKTFVPETTTPNTSGIKPPTFTDLEKLRRAAGAGKYGIHHADTKK